LLTERPGDLWRRLDHLLRVAGDDRPARAAIDAALRATAAKVAPGVLAAAAAELTGRAGTVRASEAQLMAARRAKATERLTAGISADALSAVRDALGMAGVRISGSRSAGEPAAGTIGSRPGPGVPRRVFFPGGGVVSTWTEPERREPLPAEAIAAVRELVDGELTRRSARLDRFDLAVLDAALIEVPAPMRERAASGQSAGWPRGSLRQLPDVEVLRLFLHWQDAGAARVDLDLSCVFFDADWRRLGHCDYTQLRFAGEGAVHSGDLTSAPAPLGATEFLDLDVARLAAKGARYAVPMVLSYNAVPFDALSEAFAGMMLPLTGGAQFDGARVAQRFDLRGNARMLMPMVVDLRAGRLLWTDLTLNGRGYGHSVGQHGDQLARAAADQWSHFLSGQRATVFDLLAWQAAGRADRILVMHADDTYSEVPADVAAIRAAALTGTGDIRRAPEVAGRTVLAGTVDPESLDRLLPARATAGTGSVTLTVTGAPGELWTAVRAGDLLGQLGPA